jgi:hypothetical protein
VLLCSESSQLVFFLSGSLLGQTDLTAEVGLRLGWLLVEVEVGHLDVAGLLVVFSSSTE